MTLYDLYDQRIKPAIYEQLDSVFPEMGWVRTRNGWVATDNERTKRDFGVRAERVICNATRDGAPAGWFIHGTDSHVLFTEYLNGGLKPTGDEFRGIVTELARRVGITPEISKAAAAAEKLRRERVEREAQKTREAHAQMDPQVLAYWRERSLGLEPPEDIGSSGGRLHGAIRDYRGDIVGSWQRRLDGGEPKYLYSEDFRWEDVIATNLRNARETHVATFVESVIEPYILTPHGVEVHAVGGTLGKLTPEAWERIIKWGITTVYLMGDNDEAGKKGTRKALANFLTLDQDALVDVRVVGEAAYQECKDPGEMLVRLGASSIHTARSQGVHYAKYLAEDLVARHGDCRRSSTAMVGCIRESQEIWKQIPPKQRTYARHNFFAHLEQEVPDYQRAAADIERQVEKDEQHKAHAAVVRATLERLRGVLEGTIEGDRGELARLGDRCGELALGVADLSDTSGLIDEHLNDVARYRGLDERIIGLAQRTLPTFDSATCGLRGLTLLVAPPNVGKTSLGWQWGLDILTHNPRVGFVCGSLEMSRKAMVARGICNLAGIGWRDYVFGPHSTAQATRIAAAIERMRELRKRIFIFDREFVKQRGGSGAVIRREIIRWMERNGIERVYTLIDYLQKWPLPEHIHPTQEEHVRMQEMQALSITDEDPTLVICQQRKQPSTTGASFQNELENVMGTATNTYAPDVVLFSRLASDEELREWLNEKGQEIEPLKGDAGRKLMAKWNKELVKTGRRFIMLTIAKGRDGVEQEQIPVTFYFRENKFKEEWEWYELMHRRDADISTGVEAGREVPGRYANVGAIHEVGSGGGGEED